MESTMAGLLLHQGAVVLCAHTGPAQPAVTNQRVSVSRMHTLTAAAAFQITGCTLPVTTSGAPPCATANWSSAATRVKSMGQPLLLLDSQAICVPTGTPLLIQSVQQTRVTAK
jgi:hypothetical protein